MIKLQSRKKEYINVSSHSQTKQIICDLLCKTIQATAAGERLEALRYDPKYQIVHVDFRDQYNLRQIDVVNDDGWKMVQDIVNNIYIG